MTRSALGLSPSPARWWPGERGDAVALTIANAEAVAPGAFDIDLAAALGLVGPGPFFLAFAWWFSADPAASGVQEVWLEYTDPAGQTQFLGGAARSLSDSTAYTASGPFFVRRAPNTPLLLRFSAAIGAAGAATVAYEVAAVV